MEICDFMNINELSVNFDLLVNKYTANKLTELSRFLDFIAMP